MPSELPEKCILPFSAAKTAYITAGLLDIPYVMFPTFDLEPQSKDLQFSKSTWEVFAEAAKRFASAVLGASFLSFWTTTVVYTAERLGTSDSRSVVVKAFLLHFLFGFLSTKAARFHGAK